MRTRAIYLLLVGSLTPLVLDTAYLGRTVLSIVCGLLAMVCGWMAFRTGQARQTDRLLIILGAGMAVIFLANLPAAYRDQQAVDSIRAGRTPPPINSH